MSNTRNQNLSGRRPQTSTRPYGFIVAFLLALSACGGSDETPAAPTESVPAAAESEQVEEATETETTEEPAAAEEPTAAEEPETGEESAAEPTGGDAVAAANSIVAELYPGSPMEWALANRERIETAVIAKDTVVCNELDPEVSDVYNAADDAGVRYSNTFVDAALDNPLVTLVVREGVSYPEYLMDSCFSEFTLTDSELLNMANYFTYWEGVANGEPALSPGVLNTPALNDTVAALVSDYLNAPGSEIGFFARSQDDVIAALSAADLSACVDVRTSYNTSATQEEAGANRVANEALPKALPAVAASFEAQLEYMNSLLLRCQLGEVSEIEIEILGALMDYWNGSAS